jgi:DNA-binding MarR family transcriptional regulator
MKHIAEHEPTPPGDEPSEIARELRAIWQLLRRGTPHTAGDGHLQQQQYWVLAELSRGGSRRMSGLAECSHVSQASLTGIVDRLEERGLIERVHSAEDRRVVDVSVTPAGVAELERSRAEMTAQLESMLAPLSEPQRHELLSLLRVITERHDAPTDGSDQEPA